VFLDMGQNGSSLPTRQGSLATNPSLERIADKSRYGVYCRQIPHPVRGHTVKVADKFLIRWVGLADRSSVGETPAGMARSGTSVLLCLYLRSAKVREADPHASHGNETSVSRCTPIP